MKPQKALKKATEIANLVFCTEDEKLIKKMADILSDNYVKRDVFNDELRSGLVYSKPVTPKWDLFGIVFVSSYLEGSHYGITYYESTDESLTCLHSIRYNRAEVEPLEAFLKEHEEFVNKEVFYGNF